MVKMKILVIFSFAFLPMAWSASLNLLNLSSEEARSLLASQSPALAFAKKISSLPLPQPAAQTTKTERRGTIIHHRGRPISKEDLNDYYEDNYEASQFHGQDGEGQYAFGFSAPNHARYETRNHEGEVRGSYKYLGPYDKPVEVEYWADKDGFHQRDNLALVGPTPVAESEEVKVARLEHLRLWQRAAALAAARPDPLSDVYNKGALAYDAAQEKIDHETEYNKPSDELTRYPKLPYSEHIKATSGNSQEGIVIENAASKSSEKDNEYEPKGFFYSFTYPVSEIIQKGNKKEFAIDSFISDRQPFPSLSFSQQSASEFATSIKSDVLIPHYKFTGTKGGEIPQESIIVENVRTKNVLAKIPASKPPYIMEQHREIHVPVQLIPVSIVTQADIIPPTLQTIIVQDDFTESVAPSASSEEDINESIDKTSAMNIAGAYEETSDVKQEQSMDQDDKSNEKIETESPQINNNSDSNEDANSMEQNDENSKGSTEMSPEEEITQFQDISNIPLQSEEVTQDMTDVKDTDKIGDQEETSTEQNFEHVSEVKPQVSVPEEGIEEAEKTLSQVDDAVVIEAAKFDEGVQNENINFAVRINTNNGSSINDQATEEIMIHVSVQTETALTAESKTDESENSDDLNEEQKSTVVFSDANESTDSTSEPNINIVEVATKNSDEQSMKYKENNESISLVPLEDAVTDSGFQEQQTDNETNKNQEQNEQMEIIPRLNVIGLNEGSSENQIKDEQEKVIVSATTQINYEQGNETVRGEESRIEQNSNKLLVKSLDTRSGENLEITTPKVELDAEQKDYEDDNSNVETQTDSGNSQEMDDDKSSIKVKVMLIEDNNSLLLSENKQQLSSSETIKEESKEEAQTDKYETTDNAESLSSASDENLEPSVSKIDENAGSNDNQESGVDKENTTLSEKNDESSDENDSKSTDFNIENAEEDIKSIVEEITSVVNNQALKTDDISEQVKKQTIEKADSLINAMKDYFKKQGYPLDAQIETTQNNFKVDVDVPSTPLAEY